jgi:uncharacterized membrane protein YkoI
MVSRISAIRRCKGMIRKGALALTAALTVLVVGTVAGIAWGMRQERHEEERGSPGSVASANLVTPVSSTIVAPHEAVKAALAYTRGGQADDVRLVLGSSGFVYEVQIGQGVIVVDAATGRALGMRADSAGGGSGDVASVAQRGFQPSATNGGGGGSGDVASAPQPGSQASAISAEEAQRIALSATGDSYVRKVELERKYGLPVYEVKTERHEVYVHATTGQVLGIKSEDDD